MVQRLMLPRLAPRTWRVLTIGLLTLAPVTRVHASDHLDSPAVIANPSADIGDIYAWMSPDARRLNVVMTIVGHSFSDRIAYVFHVDSGRHFPVTVASTTLTCRFANPRSAECRLGALDQATGDASDTSGLESHGHRFRLFAGSRDDPFFNNVRGTRAAYTIAQTALSKTARYDAAGCPLFSADHSHEILDAWRHTDGGPPDNFLKTFTPATIVASIDVRTVNHGGPFLAIWGSTRGPKEQVDRAARPLTGNALLATLGSTDQSNELKSRYNRTTPANGGQFVGEIAKGVALYDGFDGRCGNGFLVERRTPPQRRYRPLARLLADDRLWVNSRSGTCTELFAVERAALNGEVELKDDCGGRTLLYDSVNVYRSLLTNGTTRGVDDGVHRDEKLHSVTVFPFVASPGPPAR